MCRATMGRHGCSNICKDFNLVKENDDLVNGTDDLVKEIRRQTIEECIKTLEESYPYSDESYLIYGFKCAVTRLEQMKEVRNEKL